MCIDTVEWYGDRLKEYIFLQLCYGNQLLFVSFGCCCGLRPFLTVCNKSSFLETNECKLQTLTWVEIVINLRM